MGSGRPGACGAAALRRAAVAASRGRGCAMAPFSEGSSARETARRCVPATRRGAQVSPTCWSYQIPCLSVHPRHLSLRSPLPICRPWHVMKTLIPQGEIGGHGLCRRLREREIIRDSVGRMKTIIYVCVFCGHMHTHLCLCM